MSSTAPSLRARAPRIAEDAVERARLRVVSRERTAPPRAPFLILVSLILLVGVVGLLLLNTNMQQAAFGNRSLESQATTMGERVAVLQAELDTLSNPQSLAASARRDGMVIAPVSATLNLADHTISGEMRAAERADQVGIAAGPVRNPAPPVTRTTASTGAADAAGTTGQSTRTNRANRANRANRDGAARHTRRLPDRGARAR